jgi:hypothetical protein
MIRIIRVLEYTFENQEYADEHISKMYIPLSGQKTLGVDKHRMTIKSSGIIDLSNTKKVDS